LLTGVLLDWPSFLRATRTYCWRLLKTVAAAKKEVLVLVLVLELVLVVVVVV
jgi:hypothetical protein